MSGINYEEIKNGILESLEEKGLAHLSYLDSGTVTNATSSTLEDNTKNWWTSITIGGITLPPQFADCLVMIVEGTGAGQIRYIMGNTPTTLQIYPDWDTIPDTSSKYVIIGTYRLATMLGRLYALSNALNSIGNDKFLTKPDNPPNMDLTLSEIVDNLRGTNDKTLSDLDSDLSDILGKLDVNLSTRATEATLAAIKAQTDKLTFHGNLLEILNTTLIQSKLDEEKVYEAAHRFEGVSSDESIEIILQNPSGSGKTIWGIWIITRYGEFGL